MPKRPATHAVGIAAPAAQSLKLVANLNAGDGSFKTGDALADALVTLALMLGLRALEKEGLLDDGRWGP